MAQSPTVERPGRFPMVQIANNRANDPTKDARMINAFGEQADDGDYWVYKRPGLAVQITCPGTGWGIYNWSGGIYAAAGNHLYRNGGSVGNIDATNGSYRFNSCQGAIPTLILMNGVNAYTYDATNGFQAISLAFPSPLVKGLAFLDETMYVMDVTGNIRGSGLNDLTVWDPANVIVAQSKSDFGVTIREHLTYVVAFKTQTTSFFVDVGNAAGSPLQSYPALNVQIGCASADSMQEIDGELFWISNNKSTSLGVHRLTNGQVSKVSTKSIDRILTGFSLTTVHSFFIKIVGHRFYGITSVTSNLTLILDIDEALWYYWTDPNGNYFPVVSTSFFINNYPLVQHETNGALYGVSMATTNDNGVIFPVDIYTPNADLNTRRTKALNFLEFVGDQQPGSLLNVSCSDDDFTTWSNPRIVDLSVKRPHLDKCGSFKRRSYHLNHLSDTPFHMKALEAQIDIGTL